MEHWLNGIKVVEYERGSPLFAALVARSKYEKMEGFGLAEQGRLLLQDHGNEVHFRTIKVRSLHKEPNHESTRLHPAGLARRGRRRPRSDCPPAPSRASLGRQRPHPGRLVGFSDRARQVAAARFKQHAQELNCEIVGVSDLWSRRRDEAQSLVQGRSSGPTITTYRNNEELYEKGKLDAVIITTADFQHALALRSRPSRPAATSTSRSRSPRRWRTPAPRSRRCGRATGSCRSARSAAAAPPTTPRKRTSTRASSADIVLAEMTGT